jgi:predicted transcriptional regulator
MYKLVHENILDTANTPLEQMLDCLLGLSKLECQIFKCLLERPNGECCQELDQRVQKDRSVIQKAMKRLLEAGLIERKAVPITEPTQKAYKYVYMPAPRPALRVKLLSTIDETRLRMIKVVDDAFPVTRKIDA